MRRHGVGIPEVSYDPWAVGIPLFGKGCRPSCWQSYFGWLAFGVGTAIDCSGCVIGLCSACSSVESHDAHLPDLHRGLKVDVAILHGLEDGFVGESGSGPVGVNHFVKEFTEVSRHVS